MGAFTTYKGYPALDPDGNPWTFLVALRLYGAPLPLPIRELCNMRTRRQYERERDAMAIQSKRCWARSRQQLEHEAAAREASHG